MAARGEYEELRGFAAERAREAGDWLLERFGARITTTQKGDDSVVTELDVRSEELIASRIRDRYPDHAIIGEEGTPRGAVGEWSWVVDPIDGTRNFASGVPLWAVSVAVLERGVPVAGAIAIPVSGELYEASAGCGARLNGVPIEVGETATLSRSVVMTDPLPGSDPESLPPEVLGGLMGAARRTRMLGSVCCGLCTVAAGRFDLYYRPSVKLWDVAAGVLIVREAGGDVRSLDGEAWTHETPSILAANPALLGAFLAERRRLEGVG